MNSPAGRECRFCSAPLNDTFADLGASPLANSFLKAQDLQRGELFYPLHVYVCASCFLVQLPELSSPADIFSDYAYFSSYSKSWLDHARRFAAMAVDRFALGPDSLVVEIGSNDGYLLHYFKEAGVPVIGVEPASNVAAAAREKGIKTINRFFDHNLAEELAAGGSKADLIVGNNVLAHIPDVGTLMRGLKKLLKPGGTISMEFPHLLSLVGGNQFDTIYHEHYSYYSLTTADTVFSSYGLTIYDLEFLPTHGGSLRIFAGHESNPSARRRKSVAEALEREEMAGLKSIQYYRRFDETVRAHKRKILNFLIAAKEQEKSIAAYGAAAKGNTMLNYCGVGTDFIDYCVDRSPHKQGTYLPGSRIPVYGPEKVSETRPDYLVIMPWNLKEEISEQMAAIRDWGGRFVTLVPRVEVF